MWISVINGEENFDIVPCGVQSIHQGVRSIVMFIEVPDSNLGMVLILV